ncbi:MAG: LPD7 domain-containing protein [Novosphingobium sp.]
MGSIELNVKSPDGWQNGRNEAYVGDLDNRLADLDVRAIADRAIKDAKPGIGERLREGATKVAEALRRDDEKRREAWEVFGEKISKHYLVVREDDKRVGLYEPAGKTPAIVIDKHKISTAHESGAAIADSVKLAVDRGWSSIKLEGTQVYKDAVWLEAKKYDLKVGHNPSPLVRAELERWRATNEFRPLPDKGANPVVPILPPAKQVQTKMAAIDPDQKRDLGREFLNKTADQRLADPLLRNAELSARAARDLALNRFGKDDGRLKIAFASVDKLVSDQLRRGHQFSTPAMVPHISTTPKSLDPHRFERPRL